MGRRQQQQQRSLQPTASPPSTECVSPIRFCFRVSFSVSLQILHNSRKINDRFGIVFIWCVFCECVLQTIYLCWFLFIFSAPYAQLTAHNFLAEWPNQTYRTNLCDTKYKCMAFNNFILRIGYFAIPNKATTTFMCAQFFCTHNLMEWNVCCFVLFHFILYGPSIN